MSKIGFGIVGLLLGANFFSSCSNNEVKTTDSAMQETSISDVNLITNAGVAINENELMVTFASQFITDDAGQIRNAEIRDKVRPKVISKIKKMYFGVAIKELKNGNSFSFDGTPNVFWGRMASANTGESIAWPSQPETDPAQDSTYQETRAAATSIKTLFDPRASNLRIYYSPVSTGYDSANDKMVETPSLTLFYIDENSGARKSFLYRNQKVYTVAKATHPKRTADFTVINFVDAGKVIEGKVEEDGVVINSFLPIKIFVERSTNGSYQDLSTVEDAALKTVLEKILNAAARNQSQDANDYKTALDRVKTL